VKFLQGFKLKKVKEQLSSEKMIFRNTEHSTLGAQLIMRGGEVRGMELWNVSPWPDDKVFLEFKIFPGHIKALKDFINLYEQQFGIQNEPPPVQMLPKPRWYTNLNSYLQNLEHK
jgi:hypothetical protein